MATLAQIAAKSTSAITAAEADKVREILGYPGTPTLQANVDLTATLAALADEQVQRVRAYIDDWDAIPRQPVKKSGGQAGIEYETSRHRYEVYVDTALLLGLTPAAYGTWIGANAASGIGVIRITLGERAASSEWE